MEEGTDWPTEATTQASHGEQPARQQVPSEPEENAGALISSLSALDFGQELYLSPLPSRNN